MKAILLFALLLLSVTFVYGACKGGDGPDPYRPHPSPEQRVYDYPPEDKSKDVCPLLFLLFFHSSSFLYFTFIPLPHNWQNIHYALKHSSN